MVWMNWQLNVTILRGRAKGAEETLPKWRQSRQELPQRKEHTKNESEIGSSVEMWVDLDSVIHSNVSQKEKNKYRILAHICGIWKKWYRWTQFQGRNTDTHIEDWHVDMGDEGEELGDCCLVAKSHPTVCNPLDCSAPGFPSHHCLPEFAQTRVHGVSDALQPSHPLFLPSRRLGLTWIHYHVWNS